ncbi:MAG: carbon starvation protein A [Candidatus Marinimicrobia bacterium]|nr:carbon starvation protein A [Candidatus Neomarinimicrobiota bacterium]
MSALILMIIIFVGYILMYFLYGRFISKKIFNISSKNSVPSIDLEDGVDYVPTKKEIIFGHHFASIAGTGPIVGPAIAIIWGWLPAVLWVFFGAVFMGAVHDFGSLIISMRNQGKSISDFTSKYINKRTRILFFLIAFLELWIVIAIFGLVIAIIFKMFATAIIPIWSQIPIAMLLGFMIYNKKVKNNWLPIIAVFIMYLTIIVGEYIPINIHEIWGIPPTGIWTIILLIYVFFASILPVTVLLQPRDFINAYQLFFTILLLVGGIITSTIFGGLDIVAPIYNASPTKAPSLWPFLFITIACGAISGFHSLVSSGTTSKQILNESDAPFVGIGSMLMEGVLATLVIIAVAAGIGLGYNHGESTLFGIDAWNSHYSSWVAAKGLGSKIGAFVNGAANMICNMGIPRSIAVVIMGVFVASFAGTTLDSATRIQRYVLTELFTGAKINIFKNKYFSTAVAVISAGLLAFSTGIGGKGALKLWPLFGAVNQTLAALVLIIITLFLRKKGGYKWLVSGLPAIFMSVMTTWAIILNQISFYESNNILLQIVNFTIFIIVVWIIIEGLLKFFKQTV